MREQRPNIVFIISHDLGQHLGCYGALGVRTPPLTAWQAEEPALCEVSARRPSAARHVPLCGPAGTRMPTE